LRWELSFHFLQLRLHCQLFAICLRPLGLDGLGDSLGDFRLERGGGSLCGLLPGFLDMCGGIGRGFLLVVMDVCYDEMNWDRAFILDPMRSRTILTKDLSFVKVLGSAVIMVVGEHAKQDVDDCRIAAMAMQADVTTGRNYSAAESKFTTLLAVDLPAQVNRREDVFSDQLIVRGCRLLSTHNPTKKEQQRRQPEGGITRSRVHCALPIHFGLRGKNVYP